jgi:hypothetical protein
MFQTLGQTATLKNSILELPPENMAQLSNEDRDSLAVFDRHARKYQHRIAWALSEDPFFGGLKQLFESRNVRFARVPLRSLDTVYYLFKDSDAVSLFFDFIYQRVTPPSVH